VFLVYNVFGVNIMELLVKSVDETISIGRQLGLKASQGDIICINGELGTGKTHMTKGIAAGLGITEYITSPTFTIVNEYEGRLKLYHFDVYRVNDPDEIAAVGFDEYIFGDGVSVIEWSNYIEELIPFEHLSINIYNVPDMGNNARKISIHYNGERYKYAEEIKL
jgi:tRNA threonylcarbamoyladenosine biosynthesis protein TsaE